MWETVGMSDEWYTPKYIFDALGCRFDTDVAAPDCISHLSVPADLFVHSQSLERSWHGFCWMNPPFGGRNGILPWLRKMIQHGNGIALTPDRSSAPWWQEAAQAADAILFIKGKVKFVRPDGSVGKSPSTGTTLFAYGADARTALVRASDAGLGFLSVK